MSSYERTRKLIPWAIFHKGKSNVPTSSKLYHSKSQYEILSNQYLLIVMSISATRPDNIIPVHYPWKNHHNHLQCVHQPFSITVMISAQTNPIRSPVTCDVHVFQFNLSKLQTMVHKCGGNICKNEIYQMILASNRPMFNSWIYSTTFSHFIWCPLVSIRIFHYCDFGATSLQNGTMVGKDWLQASTCHPLYLWASSSEISFLNISFRINIQMKMQLCQ